jgi:hypothetical protein
VVVVVVERAVEVRCRDSDRRRQRRMDLGVERAMDRRAKLEGGSEECSSAAHRTGHIPAVQD